MGPGCGLAGVKTHNELISLAVYVKDLGTLHNATLCDGKNTTKCIINCFSFRNESLVSQ